PPRPRPRVDVLAPVAVGPAVEGAVSNRGQIVRHQLRAQLVALIHDRPQLPGTGLDIQGGRVADAPGDGSARAGLAVHFPDDGALFLHRHAALAGVAVGAYADVQELAVGAGRHGLGPVVVQP